MTPEPVPPARLRIDGRRLSHATGQAIRHMAVKAVMRGEAPSRVMERFGFCRTTIYRWLRNASLHGEKALDRRRHPGRVPRVRGEDAAAIRRTIVGRGPADVDLPGTMWTRVTVAELVRRRMKIRIGPMGAGRLIRRLGLNPTAVRAATPMHEDLVFAVDGRGSFLCESRRNETPRVTMQIMARLSERAKRPVRFVFAGGGLPPSPDEPGVR